MKATTIVKLSCACEACCGGSGGCRTYPDGKIPAGTTIDRHDIWKLVQMGVAVPADEECTKAAGMTDQKMKAAQFAQRRTAKGIHPDDFDAYGAGQMDGYYPDGSQIPGPNAAQSTGGLILDDDYEDDD